MKAKRARRVFDTLLFGLPTGIQWKHLPLSPPTKSAMHD